MVSNAIMYRFFIKKIVYRIVQYSICLALFIPVSSCFDTNSKLCANSTLRCPNRTECSADGTMCIPNNCGNGQIDPGEVCDDGNSISKDGCSDDCKSNEQCGNGIIDDHMGEACDDGNTASGDGCQRNCKLPRCGDGVLDQVEGTAFMEECDAGDELNSDTDNASCRTDCRKPICGDGFVDSINGEDCDDGNRVNGDGCSHKCKPEWCGNGNTEPESGEQCDDGNKINGDGCQADCTRPRCGDGIEDPGEICDDGNELSGDGCSYNCQSSEVCGNQVIDYEVGEQCDDGNEVNGDGCRSDCQHPRCGDGVIDIDEICDDNNNISGDGCSADCSSDESCGNDTLDVNEECEDGNQRDHDGCTAECRREYPSWYQSDIKPTLRSYHAMAYDTVRGHVIMFGGDVENPGFQGVWEWDGSAWAQIASPGASPPRRSGHAIVSDRQDGNILLFGGRSSNDDTTIFGDTWKWNGNNWIEHHQDTPSPTPRSHHAMALTEEGHILLFGGFDENDLTSDDTWLWNGRSWVNNRTDSHPPPRYGHTMVYDPQGERTLLFGGTDGTNNFGDTWEWKSENGWNLISSLGPPGRYDHSMVYDVSCSDMILYGGNTLSFDEDSSPRSDIWKFNGTAWLPLNEDSGIARHRHALAYDEARSKIVLFGGGRNDTRELSRSSSDCDSSPSWTESLLTSRPQSRREHTIVYDANKDTIVLFGGRSTVNATTPLDDTWEWCGSGWKRSGTSSEFPRYGHSMVYDNDNQKIIVFGGFSGASYLDTTMVRTSTVSEGQESCSVTDTWSNLLIDGPTPRMRHAMVYDSARGNVVLFGGLNESGRLHDTWTTTTTVDNGTVSYAWEPIEETGIHPSVRSGHAMAYDNSRGKVVLFGGYNGGEYLNDTWEWDGARWVEVEVVTGLVPHHREEHTLIYDPNRQKVILFGGRNHTHIFNDVWEWNGQLWEETLFTGAAPTHRYKHAMAYDPVRNHALLFGGSDDGNVFQRDTWRFEYVDNSQAYSDYLTSDGNDEIMSINCFDKTC